VAAAALAVAAAEPADAGSAAIIEEDIQIARNPDYLAEKLLGDPSTLDVDHPSVRALSLGYDEAMTDA